jgi:hypothetical protein
MIHNTKTALKKPSITQNQTSVKYPRRATPAPIPTAKHAGINQLHLSFLIILFLIFLIYNTKALTLTLLEPKDDHLSEHTVEANKAEKDHHQEHQD